MKKIIEQSTIDELSSFILDYITAVILGKCMKCAKLKSDLVVKEILPTNEKSLSGVISEWLEQRGIKIISKEEK